MGLEKKMYSFWGYYSLVDEEWIFRIRFFLLINFSGYIGYDMIIKNIKINFGRGKELGLNLWVLY